MKKCAWCGDDFKPNKHNPKQRFCSNKHSVRAWQDAHQSKVREIGAAWRVRHLDELRAIDRERKAIALKKRGPIERKPYHHVRCRKCQSEKGDGSCQKCRGRDSNLAYQREWTRANPDSIVAYSSRRRAAKRASVGSYSAAEWGFIVASQRGKCALCKQRRKLVADHIIPLSRGGSNLALNIQGLCGPCNSWKHAKELPQYNRSLFDRDVAF